MDYDYFKSKERFKENNEDIDFKLSNYFKLGLKSLIPILLIIILYQFYSGNFDYFIYDETYIILPITLMLFIIPALLFLTSYWWIKPKKLKAIAITISFLSIMVHPILFTLIWMENHERKVYQKQGIKAKAVIVRSYYYRGKRIVYKFRANEEIYESSNVTNDINYKVGDSIDVIYNKNMPKMNQEIRK